MLLSHKRVMSKMPAHYCAIKHATHSHEHVLINLYREMFPSVSDILTVVWLSQTSTICALFSPEWEIFSLAACQPCNMYHSGGFKMESISKSPQRAVRLCSGNMKQLRKQASVAHTALLLQLWVIFKRISVLGNVACAWFQILSKIILSQSCLSAMCVFRKRINIWNVRALLGSVLKEGSFEVHVVSDVGLRGFFFLLLKCFLSIQAICAVVYVFVHRFQILCWREPTSISSAERCVYWDWDL